MYCNSRKGVPVLTALICLLLAWGASAQDLGLPDGLGQTNDFGDLFGEDSFRISHLSDIHLWSGVRPLKAPKDKPAHPYAWRSVTLKEQADRTFAAPLGKAPATTVIDVPEAGAYRVWLSYMASTDEKRPVVLALTGASTASHTYGAAPLPQQRGAAIEGRMPIRFDADHQRMAVANGVAMVWEFWDTPLKAGRTTLSLQTDAASARIDSLLITTSKTFVPSKSVSSKKRSVTRTYYRFRVRPGATGGRRCSIDQSLTYHWAHSTKNIPQLWYWGLDNGRGNVPGPNGEKLLPIGEWTRWIDATDSVTNRGTFATGFLDFEGIKSGTAEVQIAWRDHPTAVLKTVRPAIADGRAVYMIPTHARGYESAVAEENADAPAAWGMRSSEYLSHLETAGDVAKRHLSYAEDAGVRPGPKPERLRLFVGCRVPPPVQNATAAMFRKLGVNWVEGFSQDVRRKHGLSLDRTLALSNALFHAKTHCPTDPLIPQSLLHAMRSSAARMEKDDPGATEHMVRLKMGDEIAAITSARHVNNCSDCAALFHDFLRSELTRMGRGPDFLGATTLDSQAYIPSRPEDGGRYERRLYALSARFKFVLTAQFYAKMTHAAEQIFPRVRSYCNFSPHPPMMGGHMNGSDWFALTRLKGASLGWAEDWATGGSWGIAGIQTVSYYGALVECAAWRPEDDGGPLPKGFYNIASCGRADRKMLSLTAHKINEQVLYSFGPTYSLADAQNAWSDKPQVYTEIARGAAALGPADLILAEGHREPRRVGILYNRSHEVWQDGWGGYQTERLMEFLALQHAHIRSDILIEEDLTPERLKPYQVLYVQGNNLSAQHVLVLEKWVKSGGVLIGIAGTAVRNEFDEAMDDGAELFGADQQLAGCSTGRSWHPLSVPDHKPIGRCTLSESKLTPAVAVDVVGPKFILTPRRGTVVGTFADGSCAALLNEHGRGKTLLFGFMPGIAYCHNAPRENGKPVTYKADRRSVISKPALATLGAPRATYTEPLTEICVFTHETGTAVTLNDFSYAPDKAATLVVRGLGDIKEVISTVRGPLKWERNEGSVTVDCPVPDPVDVVILR